MVTWFAHQSKAPSRCDSLVKFIKDELVHNGIKPVRACYQHCLINSDFTGSDSTSANEGEALTVYKNGCGVKVQVGQMKISKNLHSIVCPLGRAKNGCKKRLTVNMKRSAKFLQIKSALKCVNFQLVLIAVKRTFD